MAATVLVGVPDGRASDGDGNGATLLGGRPVREGQGEGTVVRADEEADPCGAAALAARRTGAGGVAAVWRLWRRAAAAGTRCVCV
jgi:hypothetical protein